MVYQTEKQLEEHGDKLPDDIKGPVKDGIERLKKAIEADDTDQMDSIMKELESSMHRFAEEMYKSAQQQAQQQPGGADETGSTTAGAGAGAGAEAGGKTAGGEDGEVIDADFRMVDDDK
jgi:molecular chaperone DnaK